MFSVIHVGKILRNRFAADIFFITKDDWLMIALITLRLDGFFFLHFFIVKSFSFLGQGWSMLH